MLGRSPIQQFLTATSLVALACNSALAGFILVQEDNKTTITMYVEGTKVRLEPKAPDDDVLIFDAQRK